MSERYDVLSFKRTKNDKVFAIRLGTATRRDDGGFSCYLDAMPAPSDRGVYEIQIVQPRPEGAKRASPVPAQDDSPF